MVLNFLSGGAAVSVMARRAGVELIIVDAGVAAPLPDHPGLLSVGVGRGTADMTQGPAMTREQAEACVAAGVRMATEAAERGVDIIGTGDMGIGNTTASSAITATFTRRPPDVTTGRGTGRNDREMRHKIGVVERALAVNRPRPRGRAGRAREGGWFRDRGAGRRSARRRARAEGRGARRIHLRRCRSHRAQPLPARKRLHGGGSRVGRAWAQDRPVSPGDWSPCWISA